MQKKPGIEGRRTPRRAFLRPLGVLWQGRYVVCRAIQLSEGGMLISVPVKMELKPQDKVVLTAIISGGESIIVTAEILYDKPAPKGMVNFGVRFIDLPLPQRRAIRNYVSAKTLEEAELEVDEMRDRKAG